MKAAIAAAVALYGGLHILVSNAGIQTNGDVVTTTPEVWDETMNVHVKGCFHATKYAIPAMLAVRWRSHRDCVFRTKFHRRQ